MNIAQLVDNWRVRPDILDQVAAWKVLPSREARYGDFPDFLDRRLLSALRAKRIERLYTHQAEALEAVHAGENIVVVTSTASGKTLCYVIPVLNALLADPESRALFLFPTKALSQDQLDELYSFVQLLGVDLKTYTYDGDTPQNARKAIRLAGHMVITNPDMLHTGILPHHTKWVRLFENLKFVVIDEVHQYRGVFGSHVANVIRRLRRICAHYGSHPQFILSSATIANPPELARKLIGEDVRLIDDDGSPKGEKHFIFYNPPVVNRELGIRQSSILESSTLAREFLLNDIQTIAFARTRRSVELLLTYLKEATREKFRGDDVVRGYRGGYLPLERREIERGMREGKVRGVVATNALELGIDIGHLEACVMCGYPGTITSTWQQAGRAGRGTGVSSAVLVASSTPLDQFIVNHPDYFFSQSPEHALINPNNLIILTSHIRCAAFELPFKEGERFGDEPIEEILRFLEEKGVLHFDGDMWHWMAETYPADEISLRTASEDNFVVIDTTDKARVIGEVDASSAPTLIHEEAIYFHEGQQYQIERLDFAEKKAYARRVDVDYFTDANLAVDIKVLDTFASKQEGSTERSHGEVLVTSLPTMYKKIKLFTHENVGWGDIRLPQQDLQTTAYWFSVGQEAMGKLDAVSMKSALIGVANVLGGLSPFHLMCDPKDLGVHSEIRSPFTNLPTIFIYERIPAGIGFSERIFALHWDLLADARDLIASCPCTSGCPSCVGPPAVVGERGKVGALRLLDRLLENRGPRTAS